MEWVREKILLRVYFTKPIEDFRIIFQTYISPFFDGIPLWFGRLAIGMSYAKGAPKQIGK